MRGLEANKAPGVDLIASELLQNLGQAGKYILFKLFCDLDETDVIPNNFDVNKTVTIPKKVGTDKCKNNRTISLTTLASKILTTIIYRRMEETIEISLDEDQFGFREEGGTREALLSLRLIQNGRLRVGKPNFIAFFDLEKAFDKVSWPKLFDILKNKGIKYKDRRIISSLYIIRK